MDTDLNIITSVLDRNHFDNYAVSPCQDGAIYLTITGTGGSGYAPGPIVLIFSSDEEFLDVGCEKCDGVQ